MKLFIRPSLRQENRLWRWFATSFNHYPIHPLLVRFQVRTAVNVKIAVVWVQSGGSFLTSKIFLATSIIRAMMMETARTSETLVDFNQTTQRYKMYPHTSSLPQILVWLMDGAWISGILWMDLYKGLSNPALLQIPRLPSVSAHSSGIRMTLHMYGDPVTDLENH